jgi:serine/threonine-protein kinase
MRPTGPPRISRLLITPPPVAALSVGGADRDIAITPDGSRIVYVGANGTALFVRPLDSLEATTLVSGSSPREPFISPDGQWVGFADGPAALKKVAITGGPAVTITRLDGTPGGATWTPQGSIIFASSNVSLGLEQVSAAGGTATTLTRPNREAGEADHLWPEILPSGQGVLFTIAAMSGRLDAASVAVLDLRTGVQTRLLRGGSHAHYLSCGHLVYGTAGTMRAVPFDAARFAMAGTPVPVVDHVFTTSLGALDAVVATDGTHAYIPGTVGTATPRTLAWVDRSGQETALFAPTRSYLYPRLSPDGRTVAIEVQDFDIDIWLWPLDRDDILTRLTFDPLFDGYPAWAPDGQHLIFTSERDGSRNLFSQPTDRPGAVERLTTRGIMQNATSITPDGRRLVFTENGGDTGEDVMSLRLDNRQIEPLVKTAAAERNGEVSPDGRWLAYESNETAGRFEVYVRPFPDVNSGRWQISTNGGTRPLWARNQRELFYLAADGAMMQVGIERGPVWSTTAPTRLFEGRHLSNTAAAYPSRTFDISPDGRRFLMIKPGTQTGTAPTSLVAVQHWDEELTHLVPRK